MTLEELILKIIQSEIIPDQKTLLKKIANSGYDIDQSTLSRLFKKLRIQKQLGKYVAFDAHLTAKRSIDNKVMAIPPNLIVINTKPGFASALSTTLDESPVQGTAGTVAGDDTIFVAVLPGFPLEEVRLAIEEKLK